MHCHNTVVTIPENLALTDPEKSVLSKGLNFVPIAKRTDEFSIKRDVEKFLRRVHLKAFFHDKEDDSDTWDKDILKHFKFANLNGLPQRDTLRAEPPFVFFFTEKEKSRLCPNRVNSLKQPQPKLLG